MSLFLRASCYLKQSIKNILARLPARFRFYLEDKCNQVICAWYLPCLPTRFLLYLRDKLYARGLRKSGVYQTVDSLVNAKVSSEETKQSILAQYANRYSLKILVETGTYLGNTVGNLKRDFDYIYSVELSEHLYQRAKERFKQEKHIELIHGDSGEVLRDICNKLDQPALFYLDSHYTFEPISTHGNKMTPIMEELTSIFNAKDLGHVIIIDDLRAFGYSPDFPSVKELKDFIIKHRPNSKILLKGDLIYILPSRSSK